MAIIEKVNRLEKSDILTAIMLVKELVIIGVLTDKETKDIIARLKASSDMVVMDKYLPKLNALKQAVKGI